MLLEILTLVLSGGTLATLLIFFVKRHDEKQDKNDEIKKALDDGKKRFERLERDIVRTQLLVLMAHYEEGDQNELLTCAEHYFKKKAEGGLEGDWYMTSLFKKFCEKHAIPLPPWFNGGE